MSFGTRLRLTGALVLLLSLLLSAAPTGAAIGQIDPRTPPPPTLGADDLQRLEALKKAAPVQLRSRVSPDEAVAMITVGGQAALLDIRSGALQPVNLAAIGPFVPLPLGAPTFAWRDATTLIFLAIDLSGLVDETTPIGLIEVTVNRATGGVTKKRLNLPGVPLLVSPNGQRVLLARMSGGLPGLDPDAPGASPFTREVPLRLPGPAGRPDLGPLDAFQAGADGMLRLNEEPVSLLVADLTTGAVLPLYTLSPNSALQAAAFAADGSRLAISRTELPLTGGEIESRLKSFITLDLLGQLAPEANPVLQNNVVDLIDLTGGVVRQAALRATGAGGNNYFQGLSWSPDGSVLAAQMAVPTRLPGRPHPIYLIPERAVYAFFGADGQPLGQLDRPEVESPEGLVSAISAQEMLFIHNSQSDIALSVYNRGSGELRRLPLPPGFSAPATVAPRSRQVIFNHMSFVQPLEVFRVGLDGAGLAPLTRVNAAVAALNQVRVDPVSFEQGGQTFEGYLLQPAGAPFPPQNARIVVWQEGGPFSSVLNLFSTGVERPFNLLPNFGTAVLFLPLHGRYGYGVERFRALYANDNFGTIDIDAQAAITREMIARGWTSPGRVGISGCSYGGYFVAQSMARHPDLYAAASTQCTLLDTITEYQIGTYGTVAFVVGVTPAQDAARHVRVSPLFNLNGVRTPTLIFHGTRDFLPISLAEQAHDRLQQNGAAVNMLRFIGEGHGLSLPASQMVAAQWMIGFFRQYAP